MTELSKATDKELVEELFHRVNNMNNNLGEAFLSHMDTEHRTLQQCFMSIIKRVIESHADRHRNGDYDMRNEASVDWAKDVARLDPFRVPFPFI